MPLPDDRHLQDEALPGNALSRFLRLIRFSHTIFALPFALGALVAAANGRPSGRTLLLVLICMVSARTAAMLFNRFVDWSLDQRNPRTAARHLLLPKSVVLVALIVSSAAFLAAASAINRLTFVLSPLALAIVFFYSLTKRFTAATHFFLGLALAISPIGAWIAQRGDVDLAKASRLVAGIQQPPQTRRCPRKNWHTVSKKNSLGGSFEELVERTPHLFLVQAIFSRQQTKAAGLKINQCVADDQGSRIRRMIKGDFASDGSFDFDHLQFATDWSGAFYFSESRGFQIGKALSLC